MIFLALREILRNKRHFALIAAVITLVGILVFFLSGLAVGLRSAMSSAAAQLAAQPVRLLLMSPYGTRVSSWAIRFN